MPFFDELANSGDFLSKKALDFKDFKVICWAIYNGMHREERIKLLILKLSRGMNNFRLSGYAGEIPAEFLTQDERDILMNAPPLVEHLGDGRLRDCHSKKIIHSHESSVYKIINPSGEVLTVPTLSESAKIVGVNAKTLSKYLDVNSADNSKFTAMVKDHKITRIRVHYK